MVSVQPSRASPDDIDVVISFRSASSDVVFLSADVTDWHPQQMAWNGESHEHVITVPRGTKQVLYKFRIGDSKWVHDGTVNAEPDGFFGWNNKFEIPEVPMPTPTNDFEDDTELESVAAVESIADTLSECGTEDRQSIFHDEDLIDRDEVIEDPDYAAYSQSQPSESLGSRFFGFGGSREVQYRL